LPVVVPVVLAHTVKVEVVEQVVYALQLQQPEAGEV
jgi:hypothetical protein